MMFLRGNDRRLHAFLVADGGRWRRLHNLLSVNVEMDYAHERTGYLDVATEVLGATVTVHQRDASPFNNYTAGGPNSTAIATTTASDPGPREALVFAHLYTPTGDTEPVVFVTIVFGVRCRSVERRVEPWGHYEVPSEQVVTTYYAPAPLGDGDVMQVFYLPLSAWENTRRRHPGQGALTGLWGEQQALTAG